jgi:hypothetical protein
MCVLECALAWPLMTKDHILQEIKRTAEANGGIPLSGTLRRHKCKC